MSLRLEALDLHRLLDAVFADFQSQFAVRKITLRTHLDAPTSVIPGDKVRLNQVFSNLLSNAIKFTPSGGVVSVATRTDATAQVFFIDIRDTGMGMQPAEIGRLFQRFSQGDHAHQTPGKHSGLGLGLAICHGIVNAHHGSLKAASEGLGHGSTFTVALPITVHPGD
jgi:signal transduction histidine kinase